MKYALATILLIFFSCGLYATQEKKTVKIRITAPGGFPDETTIYFDLGVTPDYAPNEDAPKAYSQIPNVPAIYSITPNNTFCSTNGYSSLAVSEVIPLGVKTDTGGLYYISAYVISNFDSTSILQLEDRQNGQITDLRTTYYPLWLADSQVINGRFFLHVSRPVYFTQVLAGCANNDGVLQVNGDNTIQWTSSYLYDNIGNFIDSVKNVSGPYNFSGLAEGDYHLVLTLDSYRIDNRLHLDGKSISAKITPSSFTAAVNQEITFYSATHNATIFQWELGDSTIIGGVTNPAYAYLAPGTYKVILTGTNDAGCIGRDSVFVEIGTSTAVTTIKPDARKIWAYDKTITAVLTEEISQGAEIKIYDMLGQPVYYNPVTDLTTVITLNNVVNGYYVISLRNNSVETSRRLFLGK